MPPKSRLARLLVPRFGVAWLFVGMLLFISVAGWWKFHHDLYVEEVEVLKQLRSPGLRMYSGRAESGWFKASEDEDSVPWNAPLIAPLESLGFYGEPPFEQRELARALPRVKQYTEWSSPEMELAELTELRRRPPVEPYDLESLLGCELPALKEPTLEFDRLDAPIPAGVPVEEEEAVRIADAVRLAWCNPAAPPQLFLLHAQSDEGDAFRDTPLGERHVLFWSDERVLRHTAHPDRESANMLDVVSDDVGFRYRGRGNLLRRIGRSRGYADEDYFRRDFIRFPYDEFPYHGLGDHNFKLVERTLEAMPQFDFDRVEKIDDVRYRIDFSPFKAVPKVGDRSKDAATITRWECVLRSDLDWAPEEAWIVENNPRHPLDRRLVQRFRRQNGLVLIEERLVRDRVRPGYAPGIRTRYAWDLDPNIADRAFDPAAVDPELWRERPLPVVRWYRVTFLLGCGLAVMLIGRRFMPKRTTLEAPDELRQSDAEVTTTT